jgi:D-alanyl-D-alanine carboxypeptidase/D-alanyl-D-alanine-endopeptidase (penicillin-binding protein 4)
MRRLTLLFAVLAVSLAPSAQAANLTATKRALGREMARAGAASGAYVVDAATGRELYSLRADVGRMPASVEKLYTGAATLLRHGAEGRLTTEVLSATLPDDRGTIRGDIVLRGGGDPTFGPTATAALAAKLVRGGLRKVDGRVIGDESAFDTFRGVPSSGYRVSGDVGGLLSALAYNRGRTGKRAPYYQANPPKFAAEAFQRELRRRGVKITGTARAGLTARGMLPLSEHRSPDMATIVRQMNQPSDNYIAEMLFKQLGWQFAGTGSTKAGAKVARETLKPFGVAPRLVDGSGLSRENRTTPREVVRLLLAMDETEVGEAFDASLAVAGRNGTLAYRMRGTPAQDRCRAKTGTLRDVSTLAGVCDTVSGRRIAFAFMMNRTWPPSARALQDRMTVALARY